MQVLATASQLIIDSCRFALELAFMKKNIRFIATSCLSLLDLDAENLDVLQGAVVAVGGNLLDGIDNLDALVNFTKDGVGTVEMRCAAVMHIVFLEFFGHDVAGCALYVGGYLVYLLTGEGLAPYDIELTATAATLWVGLVALACCGQCAALMMEGGEVDFCG